MKYQESMIFIESPGKINLHLDVIERRPDGFHNIISLFQMISLCDLMYIKKTSKNNETVIVGDFNFLQKDNTIYKTVELYREAYDYVQGVVVLCEKRIPQGAGLGGGSSNAAAVLKGLHLLRTGSKSVNSTDRYSMQRIAEKIGSDVPFFLIGPAALVTGRGEKINPIKTRTDMQIVLLSPTFSIATKEAFTWIKPSAGYETTGYGAITPQKLTDYYLNCPIQDWPFFNTFYRPLLEKYPQYLLYLSYLKKCGAIYCGITGSGSTCYGIFPLNDKKICKISKKNLPPKIKNTTSSIQLVKVLADAPLPVYNSSNI